MPFSFPGSRIFRGLRMVKETSLCTIISSHQNQQINVRFHKSAVGFHRWKQLSPHEASRRVSLGEGLKIVSYRVGEISLGEGGKGIKGSRQRLLSAWAKAQKWEITCGPKEWWIVQCDWRTEDKERCVGEGPEKLEGIIKAPLPNEFAFNSWGHWKLPKSSVIETTC